MKDWTIYMLRCSDNSLYTGITKDLQKRIDTHNSGKGAKYTRGRLPVKLAWLKNGLTESEARKEEARIKSLKKMAKETMLHSPLPNAQ